MLSTEQKTRRYGRLRAAMEWDGLDVLLIVGRPQISQRGYLRYVSDYHLPSRFAYALLFAQGDPVLISPHRGERYWIQHHSGLEDVRLAERPVLEICSLLSERAPGARRLGIAGLKSILAVGDYLALREERLGLALEDATELFDRVVAVKAPDELDMVRESSRIADRGYRRFAELVRPGLSEQELAAAVQRDILSLGACETLVLFCSGASNQFLGLPTGRILEPGDLITFWVELAGPSGYWVERGGMFSLGPPADQVRRLFDSCLAALMEGGALLRAGTVAREVDLAIAAIAGRSGYHLGVWNGHGIGLDVMERPSLDGEDTLVLEEGMVISLHPHVLNAAGDNGAHLGDVFIVGGEGSEMLSHIPHELIVVE